ncbi:MAG TPA: hypothetical protein VGA55_03455 [Bacteroidota bacterium]
MKHKKNVIKNGRASSGFSKGLIVGSLVGVAIAMVYTSRRKAGSRIRVQPVAVRSLSPEWQPSVTISENTIETGNGVKSRVVWRVVRSLVYAVALFMNSKTERP